MKYLGGSARFRSNLVKIASANTLGQIFGLAALPMLSRMYSPNAFAVLTSFTLAYSICLALATGRVDWSIPNSKTEAQLKDLIVMGVGVLCLSILIIGTTLYSFGGTLENALDIPAESNFLILLPIAIVFGGILLLLQALNVYGGDLAMLSLAKLLQSLGAIVLSIAAILLPTRDDALIMAYIGGCIIAVLVLSRDLRYIIYTCTTVAPIRFLQIVAKQYRQCLSSVALSLANIMTTSGPVILLIAYYDSTTVGWYGLVFRVATAPIGLITTAVSQSFWTEAASLSKSDPTELRRFYLGTIRRLSLIAAPSFTVFLLAPLYIPYLFGQEEWGGAGYLLAAVAPYLAGMIVFSPTTHLIVYRKAHWQLAIDLVTFIVSTGTFTSLALSGQSAAAALFGSSLIMLAGYLVRFAAHLRANQILSEEFNKRPATESLAIRSQYV